ncbi:SAVED domain-containing protein [Labilibaculum euxinus]
MARRPIPEKIKLELWIKSAGRCEFSGCNEPVWYNDLTLSDGNFAEVAHIIGASEDGPRGSEDSGNLQQEFSNLMLLCRKCHKEIDDNEDKYSVKLLRTWKKEHEDRISLITSIKQNHHSHIVSYKANVGQHTPSFDFKYLANYLLPNHYPAQSVDINLGLEDSPFRDKDNFFYEVELKALETNFAQRLAPLLSQSQINHISLFAFAPMPLLIKLGTLLNDIHNVEIHQPVRNPKTWNLSNNNLSIIYKVIEPDKIFDKVALNISLSADIENSRITNILGDDCSIYTLTIDKPFNDFLKSKDQLNEFSKTIRLLLNRIKLKFNSKVPLNIFPAMPIATAIELGRCWMPKADMPLVIFDENKINDGFFKTFEIK